ncbi:Kelch repeat-containing protein [Crateriforma conspicua]|uniref:N-acetylneuraminate epimerase n=1 Tax=Crateriforma conspicua TaxID=2527996 RepID=A0A5C5Y128_9PLAN|nr:kelch repeat-containing protein [Crateriforma conspicua]TWT69297.1 N-acetylneuraminate epimerase precursor [Crateriforma conspicua]
MRRIVSIGRSFAAIAFLSSLTVTTPSICHGHMSWLASDDEGHAVFWFGESPADRTYHLPDAVAGIELKLDRGTSTEAIATAPVDTDDLVGLKSDGTLGESGEVFGSVTYGLYHGTRLTYHVEHLVPDDATKWPTAPRADSPLQTVIVPGPSGGVLVTVLQDGKPTADVEVKLYDAEGTENASATTDSVGIATFKASSLSSGLNAVLVGVQQSDVEGELDGTAYTDTADYLTSTFVHSSDNDDAKPTPQRPTVDATSKVNINDSGLDELPEELTSFGAAISGSKLFVYGGHTGEAHSYSNEEQSNRLWCLDLEKGEQSKWQQVCTDHRLQGLAMVPYKNGVIRIGGFTAMNEKGEDRNLKSQTFVRHFDANSGSWTDLPALPEPRSSTDAAILGDTIYVIGGWKLDGESDNSVWHETAWKMDLSADQPAWQPIASPPFQRRALAVAAFDGKIYAIGGMKSVGGPTTRTDIYDPSSDTWTEGPSMPGTGMAGFGASAFACGDHLYVSTMDGFLHRLGFGEAEWTTVAKIDPARFFHRMLPLDDHRMLMIGGANMEIGKFTDIALVDVQPQN